MSSNFAKLKDATISHPSITPINAAVGDQQGKLDIWLSLDNSQAHSLVTVTGGKTEVVDVVTIDDFCQARNVQPDLVKLDVEGFELKALAGARRMLADAGLRAIVTEATFDPHNKDHTQIADLMAILKPFGFNLVSIHDQCHWQRTQQLEFFNALFVKRKGTTP